MQVRKVQGHQVGEKRRMFGTRFRKIKEIGYGKQKVQPLTTLREARDR